MRPEEGRAVLSSCLAGPALSGLSEHSDFTFPRMLVSHARRDQHHLDQWGWGALEKASYQSWLCAGPASLQVRVREVLASMSTGAVSG